MKSSELKGKKIEELNVLLKQFKKEAFNLRFQKAAGSLENPARVKIVRKTIARIKTFINQN